MSRQIEVTVKKDGSTSIKASGFSGATCLAATKALEEALGKCVSGAPTHEMFTSEKIPQNLEADSQ